METSVIDAGADVKDSPETLLNGIKDSLHGDKELPIPSGSYETLRLLISVGAKVQPKMMVRDFQRRTVELNFLISQNMEPESHQDFFGPERDSIGTYAPVVYVAYMFDDCRGRKAIQQAIDLCHHVNCNKCLVSFSASLRVAAIFAASRGKHETLQLLLDKVDLTVHLSEIFIAGIKSGSRPVIDSVLSFGPDLDTPALRKKSAFHDLTTFSTPMAETVRHENIDLRRVLEGRGCLDHINEGHRFQALIQAAAEAGNVAYMTDLLASAVTSKKAYRESGAALALALREDHRDIVQMLLEAGATFSKEPVNPCMHAWKPLIEALDSEEILIVQALIASGAVEKQIRNYVAKADYSVIVDMAHEYPELKLEASGLQTLLAHSMTENALDSFKDFLEHLVLPDSSLEYCLKTAVEMGRVDMVEHFLDLGANPFHHLVLPYVITERPEMLRLLFTTERCRQTIPKCIGASMLGSVMGYAAGNAEALDKLIRLGAINFTRLEILDEKARQERHDHDDYTGCRFTPLGMAIQGAPGKFESNLGAMRRFLDAGADPGGISKSNELYTKGSP